MPEVEVEVEKRMFNSPSTPTSSNAPHEPATVDEPLIDSSAASPADPDPTPPTSPAAVSAPLRPVEELQALCDAATAGPWEAYFTIHGDPYVVPADRPWPSSQIAEISTGTRDYGRADALFIAAARTALPALLARLRAAEETLAAVERLAAIYERTAEVDPTGEFRKRAIDIRAALAEGASR